MVYNNILEAMGNTPLIRLNNIVSPDCAEILVKFEGLNVGGSIKTRTAYNMIKDAEDKGLIDKDTYKADFIKLQQELNEMLAAQKKQITRSAVMDRIISDSDFLATYANLSRAQQRELWQSLIKRITFTRRPEDRRKPYTEFHIEFI